MTEYAGREQEIEARAEAVEWLRKFHRHDYSPSYPAAVGCSICFLLVQLREARKKLAAVKGENKRLREALVAYAPMGKTLLDRILKGGD